MEGQQQVGHPRDTGYPSDTSAGHAPAAGGQAGEAVVLYRAESVFTLAGQAPGALGRVEALAVQGDRVKATGALNDLRERFPRAPVVDFGASVIVPGFHDAHMHLMAAAEDLLSVDVSPSAVRSLSELKAKLRAEAEAVPSGTWIRGSRYDDAKMAEGRTLTRWDLDEVAPDHPVLVTQIAGHWAVVNSCALALAGLTDVSEDPPGGVLGRDAAGRLNGILYEQALFNFATPASSAPGGGVVPPFSDEERLRALSRALRMFHAAGLTSVSEAWCAAGDLALFREAERRGLLTARLSVLVAAEHYDVVRRQGFGVGPGQAPGSGFVRVSGVKTFIDGAVGGRTCLLEQPFEGTSDDYGIQTRTTGELRDILRQVTADGTRLCVHANGDRAITLLLGLFEEDPHPELHHRIEHCSIVSEEILQRMVALNAIAVPFGSYVHYHGGNLLDWYGTERVRRMFAHRWFIDAGVAVAGSSDYPCGPFEPLLALQSCVTRRGWDGAPVGEQQRVTALEALRLYTVGAAFATGELHEKGRLAPGYLADFVVLGDNPLLVDPLGLSSIPILSTYVGGKQVWAASNGRPVQ